jgi:hypothetical protein
MLIIRLNYISVLKMSVTRPNYYIGTCRGEDARHRVSTIFMMK